MVDFFHPNFCALSSTSSLEETGVCDEQTMMQLIDAYVGGVPKDYGRNFYNPQWYEAKDRLMDIGIRAGEAVLLTDLRTDITFRICVQAMDDHIDAEPLTAADARAMCRVYGVKQPQDLQDGDYYRKRPMLLTVRYKEMDVQIVCSMYGVPHGIDTIENNLFEGSLCVYLTGSKMHGRDEISEEHEQTIAEAVDRMRNIVEEFLKVSGQNTLTLPEGLHSIGAEAFQGITSDEVVIAEGCKDIGSRAFADCRALVRVVIPGSVNKIAEDAFDGCSTLILVAQEGSPAYQYAISRCMIWKSAL